MIALERWEDEGGALQHMREERERLEGFGRGNLAAGRLLAASRSQNVPSKTREASLPS